MNHANLVKGQVHNLVKADGSAIAKIRVGLSWDVSEGINADLDLFVVQKGTGAIAFFNDKKAIAGIELGADNLTWEGDGDDETCEMDGHKTVDGTYVVCVNIYNGKNKGQSFEHVNNAKATVYNSETNEKLAEYKITENGWSHTALIVGHIVDTGEFYSFHAKGDFIDGDINQVAASI